MQNRRWAVLFVALALGGAGCFWDTEKPVTVETYLQGEEIPTTEPGGVMALRSSAFTEGELIPSLYTCNGLDVSPPLTFVNLPQNTVVTALVMEDLDAPQEFAHWVVYNIPSDVRRLRAGDSATGESGTGTGGRIVYEGPCPPEGEHRYRFTLYALNDMVDPLGRITLKELRTAMRDIVIKSATLTGRYGQ